MGTTKTACILCKGPSVQHCTDFISTEDDIVSINDAGKYYDGPIKYVFSTHPDRFFNLNVFGRAQWIVVPGSHKGLLDESCQNKLITYKEDACAGDLESFVKMICSGGICHHHTTTGAIHWLCKFGGYTHIKIIGLDGGVSYFNQSDHTKDVFRLRDEHGINFLDEWKNITLTLIGVMENIYGTTFELYNPSKNK